ncbi:hypothetical protein L4C39_19325 [Vibrio clamense]|uniref:hypothetical protein n=1 Tax=Vibrio clamense TaxID=2910254 RepID=UPI003D1B12F5
MDTSNSLVNSSYNIEGAKRLYSPTQVACGTLGGPVGLVYFIYANFIALKNESGRKNTLKYGALFIFALAILMPFLPENVPSSAFTAVYIVIARYVVKTYQMEKNDINASSEFEFHSNWRVFGISLLCLLASVVVLLGPILLMVMTGVIE